MKTSGVEEEQEIHETKTEVEKSPFFPRKSSKHTEILRLRLPQVREHACWLWSRLGVSLMTLEDRNVWLEDENKRLEQEGARDHLATPEVMW